MWICQTCAGRVLGDISAATTHAIDTKHFVQRAETVPPPVEPKVKP